MRLTRRRATYAAMMTIEMPPTMSYRLQGQSKMLEETTANMIMALGLTMIFV